MANPYSLNFAGTDYVTIADTVASRPVVPFTVALWVKTSQIGNKVVWEKSTNVTIQRDSDDKFKINCGGVGNVVKFTNTHNDGLWHMLVFVVATGASKSYIDGVDETGSSTNPGVASTGTSATVIGSRSGTVGFIGKIDDVRLWNRALTASEIADMYTKNAIPTGIVSEYHFDEGSGSTTTDSSINANNGTITGATYSSDAPTLGTPTAVVKSGFMGFF